ncbi:Transcription factor vib-1 [Zalerion maritima]|uniref:Transcription factor vib-1 n=1 Tax=Zalerion maritima TaxID=339359 RepID=A0AAD5RS80_9PEZI|nr:Transcription factor vib-1 [Zalerion maritima]
MSASATAAYPPTSIPESYPKVPLSATQSFTAEPQEMPISGHTSMAPPVVPLATDPHPSPAIRTQYAYSQATSAPTPQMSLAPAPATNNENTLSVPRYIENNPRPAKSPRTAGHQSVHSSGSISNEQSEYRYGPPYGAAAPAESAAASAYTTSGPNESGPHANTSAGPTAAPMPPRDYLPTSNSWTTTAGDSTSSVSYTNGDTRTYSYPDYKSGPVKNDQQAPAPPPYTGPGLSHYSWTPS